MSNTGGGISRGSTPGTDGSNTGSGTLLSALGGGNASTAKEGAKEHSKSETTKTTGGKSGTKDISKETETDKVATRKRRSSEVRERLNSDDEADDEGTGKNINRKKQRRSVTTIVPTSGSHN